MLEIDNVLRLNNLYTKSYKKQGNVILVDTNKGKKVIKKSPLSNSFYDYLNSRAFSYYPHLTITNDYKVMDSIDELDTPKEEKMQDLVKVMALLHNKTTYYKEVNEDTYKIVYEKIKNNIDYLNNYYTDLINVIDGKVYMSPSEYLIANNISKIFNSLVFAQNELEEWFNLVKDTKKRRYALIHNNLKIDHFRKNEKPYLISWERAKSEIPIYDFYVLYKNHALDYDFDSLLKIYEKEYPLHNDEKKLLFILVSLPYIEKIDFTTNEYSVTKKVSKLIDYIYKTDNFISPYYTSNTIDNK